MSYGHDWKTPCREYTLRLTSASWQQMERESDRSGAIETGGILVGYYTNDKSTAIVTEALLPPKDSARGRSWFHRGIAGLSGLLTKRWDSRVRTYYIGEWHYHPASTVDPSNDDLAQMYRINIDPQYYCREPIMLIVGQSRFREERAVRAFIFPQGKQYIELIRGSAVLD